MPEPEIHDLGAYRNYLKALALAQISVDLRGPIDPSDVVQETLYCATRDLERHRGQTPAEMMGWLREILRCRLADCFGRLGRRRQIESLDRSLEQTSAGINRILWASSQSTPEDHAKRNEEAEILKTLLEQLTPAQAEALILKHCRGMSVAEISRHMNRTPAAVGGLLRHGMERLRKLCNGRIEP
jgi:RNA polymerase sigma-70 factor (ECF subfamily)